MPVKYAPMLPTEPKEFVVPNASDSFIWWLFKHLCVVCHKPATEINEIVPRSRSKESILNWENRVTMCRECHGEYHRHGVNFGTQEELFFKRQEALKLFGREEYIDYVSPVEVEIMEELINA